MCSLEGFGAVERRSGRTAEEEVKGQDQRSRSSGAHSG